MEEDLIVEERSADEAGKHGNDHVVVDVDDLLWVKYMEAKLASKPKNCQPSPRFTICRVPTDIRRVDSLAYDPLIVSIGPYHRGNPRLLEMEEVKWRNLNEFRGRAGKDFKKYLKAMKEIEPRARDCYSGKIDLTEDEFIEMMLLDGLIIIEFLSTKGYSFLYLLGIFNINRKEAIYTLRGMLCRVGHDMLLLENQLPFFVLERLWKLTGQRMTIPLWQRAYYFIRRFAMQFEFEWDFTLRGEIFVEEENKKKKNPGKRNADSVDHLLHLTYLFLEPTCKPTEPTAFIKKTKTLSFLPPRCRDCFPSPSACQKSQFVECTAKLPAVIKEILPFLSPSKSKYRQPPPLNVIPSAAELDEAGVEFQCAVAKSFLDIEFEHGTMKIPRLSVQDSTNSLLRNFIAYEQCFPNQGSHITSYCSFMDQLVNTPRDVEILKKSDIIENWLGSDKEVALLFNDLRKGIFLPDDSCNYLAKPSEAVRKYTKQVWPKWRAKLVQDYFGSPWLIISFFAATFVIFLTAVQTYEAVFT